MTEYPAELAIQTFAKPVNATVSVPGSKSITNRALVLAALASRETGCTLTGALRSEDTEVMVECLLRLGFKINADWLNETINVDKHDSQRLIPADEADLYVANSGTTVRFVSAMVSLSGGRYRLDGVKRMNERPIQDLLDALNQIDGVRTWSEPQTGCPPIVISGIGWKPCEKRVVRIRSEVSSQFLSGLLMAASSASGETVIHTVGQVVSEPYILMTEGVVHEFGGRIFLFKDKELGISIQGNFWGPTLEQYRIEPDASSASYFFAAAAITGGHVTVLGMKREMLQGDVKFVDALEKMGCRVEECNAGITVHGRPLKGINIDMNAISDTVMTLAAVACFAEGPTTIRNVAHIRHKETDRIAAVATELRKLGVEVEEFADGLRITPRPMTGCAVETYNDHRMAMSLALIGLKVPGVIIKNPGCVAKTYPGFWQDFEKMRN
jgi:3-phosphoshikimate 1-carboxyvinyltransferase